MYSFETQTVMKYARHRPRSEMILDQRLPELKYSLKYNNALESLNTNLNLFKHLPQYIHQQERYDK